MPLPSSGQLSFSQIACELECGTPYSNLSLRNMSSAAGKTQPDAVSEFYGYSKPTVVTSGLLTYYDISNTSSYPGSGTVVYDLSACARNGTLTNGACYVNECSGGISFDGTNDYINIGNNPISGNAALSVEWWFKLTADGSYCEPLTQLSNQASNRMRLYIVESNPTPSLNVKNYSNDYYSGVVATPGTITYFSVTEDTSNCIRVYKNGSLSASGTRATTNTTCPEYYLGYYQFDNRYYKGVIYEHRLYNRTLTSTEICTNYDATKTRFGL